MDCRHTRFSKAIAAIPFASLMILIGMSSHAAVRLWDHGDRHESKESRSTDAIRLYTDNDSVTINSVDIYPECFTDTETSVYMYGEGDTLRHTYKGVADIYTLFGDTLYWLGTESRATQQCPDRAVAVYRMPIDTNSALRSDYSGILGYWGDRPVKRIFGFSESQATKGLTITVGTDTIHDVTMLEWNTEIRMEPDTAHVNRGSLVFEEKTLDRTSIHSCRKVFFGHNADGVCGSYPMLTVNDTYRLTDMDSGVRDTVPLGRTSRWIPELTAVAAESDAARIKSRREKTSDSYSEEGYFPIDIDTRLLTDDTILLSISSQEGEKSVTATLWTADGIVIGSPQTVTTGAIPTECRFLIPTDIRGVILIRLEAGEATKTIKVIR